MMSAQPLPLWIADLIRPFMGCFAFTDIDGGFHKDLLDGMGIKGENDFSLLH